MLNNSLPVQQIAPGVFVAGQLESTALQALANAGFKCVINNRPDYEGGPTQPTNAAMQAAALAAGLEYHYLPVQGAYQSPAEIAAFALLLSSTPRPLLAFCRSGARSTRLYEAATQS